MTIEKINSILGSNFTLVKRNGAINDSNVKIMERLVNITEEEIREFMRTDEMFNAPASVKHAKGYHALRALDKWYKERANNPSAGNNSNDAENGTNSDNSADNSTEGNELPSSAENGAEGANNADNGNSENSGDNGNSENADSENADADSNENNDSENSDSDNNDSENNDSDNSENSNSDLTDTEKQVLAMITRPQGDKPNNVYLYGPAGTGKSYMVKRVAEKIGAGYWETGIVNMKEELLGFTDAGGRYVAPECAKILKNGIEGKDIVIMNFDEFDGFPNAVTLTFNNIFASRRFSTPEGVFDVHPSIHFVATGNTTMDGADEFYDRETVDKSVKTRWIFKAVNYDKQIEKKLADAETVKFLQGLRRAKDNCGLDMMVTYREFTALNWARSIVNDKIMTYTEALDSCVFKGLTQDDKDTLRGDRMMQKLIEQGNIWAMAF